MIAARCVASYARHRSKFSAARLQHNVNTQHSKRTMTTQNYTSTNKTAGQSQRSEEHLQTYKKHNEEFDMPLVVSVLRQENATDMCVIRVPQELKYTNHMIIVNGSSPRHITAMAELLLKVYKFLQRKSDAHVRLEGRDCDDWKCIDFGSLVIHLMLQETRETYELEKLWTLRSYDQQLMRIPPEMLPTDFIYDINNTNQTNV